MKQFILFIVVLYIKVSLSQNFTMLSDTTGNITYQTTDHRNNVYNTTSNQKLFISSTNNFNPNVLSYADYYPFGSVQPGRSYSPKKYRFGFENQEKEDYITDVDGGHLFFKFRIYDSRLGKFLSVDPLFKEYSWNSTYAFAENDVIRAIDLEGAEKWITIKSELLYGPYSLEYTNIKKLKSIYEVVSSDLLVAAVEKGQSSKTFVETLKSANLYNYTTISNDELGTFTTPNSSGGASININKKLTDPSAIFTRVAFELNNAKNIKSGGLSDIREKASNGKINKNQYIKGLMTLEAEAKLNEYKVNYETGGTLITKEQYTQINDDFDKLVKKLADEDYKSGTRETRTGSQNAKKVYGKQYKKFRIGTKAK